MGCLRRFAADFRDGLDDGLAELLWVLGINRPSRTQRRAAAAFIEGKRHA